MKLIILILCLSLTGCATYNKNKLMYAVAQVAAAAAWGQSRAYSAKNGTNLNDDDKAYAGVMLINTLAFFILPEKYQTSFFGVSAAFQAPTIIGGIIRKDGFNSGL